MQTSSLLPYLQGTEGHLFLDLRPSYSTGGFRPGYRADLPAAVFKVQLRSNSGSLIMNSDLMVQSDLYPSGRSDHETLTNSDIDFLWQQAYLFHLKDLKDHGAVILQEQVGENEQFLAFHPLLFCSRRNIYFGLTCPYCRHNLQLCRDDSLLLKNGLPSYSTSLHRYLYCPDCPEQEPRFYVKNRTFENPAMVADEKQLLAAIEDNPPHTREAGGLPCWDCPYNEGCFGEQRGVEQTVAVFSFYPFYAVLLESSDCSGAEFIKRVSGWNARSSEIDVLNIPSNEGFLHTEQNSLHYIEVLFLKVLFLYGASTQLYRYGNLPSVNGGHLSAASFRVRLNRQTLLSKYWEVSVTFPGMYAMNKLLEVPDPPLAVCDYLFGLLWFSVLGVNSQQQESDIFRKLLLLMKEEEVKSIRLLECFPPDELLWEPSQQNIPDDGKRLYRDAVRMGWDIFRAGYFPKEKTIDRVPDRIMRFLQVLRRELLSGSAGAREGQFEQEDRVIAAALKSVQQKWLCQEDGGSPAIVPANNTTQPDDFHTMDDLHSETIVIKNEQTTVAGANVHHADTVIISDKKRNELVPEPAQPQKKSQMNTVELEETVRLKPETAGVDQKQPAAEEPGEGLPEETVVLGNRNSAVREPKGAGKAARTDAEIESERDEDDFLTETVVLKPRKKDG